MDLSGVLRRQWYIVLFGLAMTFGLGFAAASYVGVSYETKGMVVLLPPSASVPKAGNPYLNLANMSPVAGVLADAMGGDATGEMVKAISPTAKYTVAPDPSTSGSVIIIDVKDSKANTAQSVMNALVREAPHQLDQLQSATDTPKPGLITTDLVARDQRPTASHKSQLRAALVAIAAGTAFTLAAASFFDGFRARRAARIARGPNRHAAHINTTTDADSGGGTADEPNVPKSPAGRRLPGTRRPTPASGPDDELTAVGALGKTPAGRS